jgi:hypothetical protein
MRRDGHKVISLSNKDLDTVFINAFEDRDTSVWMPSILASISMTEREGKKKLKWLRTSFDRVMIQ